MAVVTSTALTLGALAVSAGTAAYGQYSAGKAEEAMNNRNAEQADELAKQKNWEALENSRRQRANNDRILSSARARLAALGSPLSTGAPLEILGDVAGKLELEVLDAYRSAETEMSAIRNGSQMQRWAGTQAANAGTMQAAGTLLSGLTQLGSSGYQAYRSGSLLKS